MPLRQAARVAAGLVVLLLLYLIVRQLPVLRWIVEGAKLLHGEGALGAVLTALGMYLLTLFLLPIVPLIVACGWLYGVPGALLSLVAAVGSAATSFSIARALAGKAAAQALLERPRVRALADLAAEGGLVTVALVRLSPILPFTPSNAVLGLTAMRQRDLVLGTALGMAPGIVLYSWAGSLLPSAEAIEQGATLHSRAVWILLAVAFAAATVLGTAAARRLRKVKG